jgi:serine phosphatase RsbU (regulator of sigma subunit)
MAGVAGCPTLPAADRLNLTSGEMFEEESGGTSEEERARRLEMSGSSGTGGTPRSGASADILTELTRTFSAELRASCRMRRFAPGDLIVREGDPGCNAFILVSGQCEVTVHGETLNLIHPGELFGEIACLEAGTRTATVRAAVMCDVLELPGPALLSELRRSPALLDKTLRTIAHRVRHISRREAAVRDEQRQLRRALEELQPSLDRFKNDPALSVEVVWRPLGVTSGDYYDVLELAPDRFLFAVGDVMGHGARTTPIIGMIRGQLHEAATAESRPHELLTHLHRHLLRHGPPNVFVTMTLLTLDVSSLAAEFAIGGPPCPFLYRDGRCTPLTTHVGWTLGYPFQGISFDSERLELTHDDALIFYTDGLSDAACGRTEKDTLEPGDLARLVSEACGAGRARESADRVFTAVERLRSGWPVEDDVTVLVVTVL